MWIKDDIFQGEVVSLESLKLAHTDDLRKVAEDGDAWQLWFTTLPKPDEIEGYVKTALKNKDRGELTYVVRSKFNYQVIGTTRYYNVDEMNRRVTIGFTWYGSSVRRTPVNTECKWLLLSNMFENYQAIAVEFKTHYFNPDSRKAIERLGAKQDSILRSHKIMPDGSLRDTVVYSIIASEWPAVKCNLRSKMHLPHPS
ncbi:GNAT family N-acetyltransferase [Shewanella surugensis]|uniref:GNAT family N-acetyltransferase n=1 Tax=Shewanella surugensis TaxID=212020 RepID=A0ABT0LA15_9GAMM|nr:GNAT family protein [Shewanella surugensis]MCL1124526.1 GNAT family N-acetyltransferase [Shewanella surugensis]